MIVDAFRQFRGNAPVARSSNPPTPCVANEGACQDVCDSVTKGLQRTDATDVHQLATADGLQTISKFGDGSRLLTLKDADTGRLTKAIYQETTLDESGLRTTTKLCAITCKSVAEEASGAGGLFSRIAIGLLGKGEPPNQSNVVEYHRSLDLMPVKGNLSNHSSITQQVAVGSNQVLGAEISCDAVDWSLGRSSETPPLTARYARPGSVDAEAEGRRQSLLGQTWLLSPGG